MSSRVVVYVGGGQGEGLGSGSAKSIEELLCETV